MGFFFFQAEGGQTGLPMVPGVKPVVLPIKKKSLKSKKESETY